jgi:AraC-like DNA-binding protein
MNEEEKKRLKAVQMMLTEIAGGNFSYRIERSDKNDLLESVVDLINMTAEELRDAFVHQGFINLGASYYKKIKLFFLLDVNDHIVGFGPMTLELLGREVHELMDIPFTSLLHPRSRELWENGKEDRGNNEKYLDLTFHGPKKLNLELDCNIIESITKTPGTVLKMVICVRIKKRNLEKETRPYRHAIIRERTKHGGGATTKRPPKEKTITLSPDDIEKIRNVRNYLKENMHLPMESLVFLARRFGTNEYKLKYGFKQLNGDTVAGYLQKERLNRALGLIENTTLPIKAVTKTVGFKNVSHFSHLFKQRYGASPRKFRANLLNTEPKKKKK